MLKKIYLFLLLMAAATSGLLAQTTERHVLVIGIDGCRADVLRDANTPAIHGLLDHAVYSFDALTHYPTWSGPGWSSMCTGVWETKHGVLDNSFVGSNYDAYPHFIKRAETFMPGLHSASIVHWSPINTVINTKCDIEINVPTDVEVRDAAVAYLENNNPDILFVDFDDVDHAGHLYGFSPTVPEYVATVELTDGYVGNILDALKARPGFAQENWLVLLTTDHGGNLAGHGGASFEERNVFIIAWQPGQAPQEIAKDSTVFELTSGLQFNGTDQYLLPEDNTPFLFGDTQNFSIEMRVRYTDLQGDAAFISNKDWNSGLNPGWVISTPFGVPNRWKVNISDGTIRKDVTGGFIADGNWHHLTVTFDRAGLMKLYEDGNPIGEADISTIGNIDAGLPLVIGQDGTFQYPYWFNGSIAEVRIWNTVLDAATVSAYTCGTLDANHPYYNHLIAYWKMAEGAGNTIGNAIPGAPACALAGAPAQWTAQPGGLVCEDFSQTPRLVDIGVTALTHLCVPIDTAWGLDGHSLVPSCLTTGADAPLAALDDIQLFPNPATDKVVIKVPPPLAGQPMDIALYSAQGRLILAHTAESNDPEMSLQQLPAGFYFLKVKIAGREWVGKLGVD